jgi:hypothetical protein
MALSKFLEAFMKKKGRRNRKPKPPAKDHPYKRGFTFLPPLKSLSEKDYITQQYVYHAPKQKNVHKKFAG